MCTNTKHTHSDIRVEAVVTSYNQGTMILEAVESLLNQTVLPERILIIDDGSFDESSINILKTLENRRDIPLPVTVYYQKNGGVSAARNTGVSKTNTPLVLILDGDDKLEPEYIESVGQLLHENPLMVAASSWMHTFGVLDAIICPKGGEITSFLSHNCCSATHICRRETFFLCNGYDESMQSGFEDWDFFISLLETKPEGYIGIVQKPLINYRTTSTSSNIKSMDKRLDIMRYMIHKHIGSYQDNITEALLGIEKIANSRLYGWEKEMIHSRLKNHSLCQASVDFLKSPSYGDGGMASAIRIVSADKS